jgi:hypothetical protein
MREYYHVEGKRHSGEIEYAVLMESAVQADILMQWAQKNLADWEWTIEIARTNDDAESCIKFLAEAKNISPAHWVKKLVELLKQFMIFMEAEKSLNMCSS